MRMRTLVLTLHSSLACALSRGAVPSEPMQILGRGWDLSHANFWDYTEEYTANVFSDDMPASCYEDLHCTHLMQGTHYHFDSIGKWQEHLSSHLGFGEPGGKTHNNLLHETVASSLGTQGSLGFKEERNVFFAELSNRQKCYGIKEHCLWNESYIHARMKRVLEKLPTSSVSIKTMRRWEEEFIGRFGTYVNIVTEHGARLKVLTSSTSSCHVDPNCQAQLACQVVGFVHGLDGVCNSTGSHSTGSNATGSNATGSLRGSVSGSFAGSPKPCEQSESCKSLETVSCHVAGGSASSYTARLCRSNVSAADVDDFLDSTDSEAGSSAINYRFVALSQILLNMGWTEHAETLERATDFHACTYPRWKWGLNKTSGEHHCQCNLRCHNGGVLDPSACVCSCQGDPLHGFAGSTCEDQYGTCVAGPGTQNFDAATQCSDTGMCKSWFNKYFCEQSELCCMTDFDGACCPFGSTCDCDGWTCKCATTPYRAIRWWPRFGKSLKEV